MGCDHKHLRTVGFKWFCADCGEELNPKELFGGTEQAKKPPVEEKTDKPTPKKRTAKKA